MKKIISFVLLISSYYLVSQQPHEIIDEYTKKIDSLFKEIPPADILSLMITQEKRKLVEKIFTELQEERQFHIPQEISEDYAPLQILSPPAYSLEDDPITFIKDSYQNQEFSPVFLAALRYLQNPKKFLDNHKPICNTFLFAGPPGCGKTHLAELLQKVFQLPMVSVSAAALHNRYVGAGAEKVSQLFSLRDPQGRILIIFIDEIDGMTNRFQEDSHIEQRNTLNSLLIELQKNAQNPYIFVIAATNCKESLDPALLSRFEGRIIEFQPLTPKEREKFIYQQLPDHCTQKATIAQKLARSTQGISRRVIARLINDVDLALFAQASDANYCLKFEDFLQHIHRIKKEGKLPIRLMVQDFIKKNIMYINLSVSLLSFIGVDHLLKNKLAAMYCWLSYWYQNQTLAS